MKTERWELKKHLTSNIYKTAYMYHISPSFSNIFLNAFPGQKSFF